MSDAIPSPSLSAKFFPSRYLWAFIVCLAMFPLFYAWLGLYTVPIADDLDYGMEYGRLGFWGLERNIYFHLSGRYISNVVLGFLGSHSDSLALYHSYPLFHLSLMLLALRCLVSACHTGSRLSGWCITLALSAAYLTRIPSLSQALYWMAGSFTYFLGFNALFGTAALLAIRAFTPERWKKWHNALLMLAIFVCQGCNEITVYTCALLTTAAWGLALLTRHSQARFLGYAAVFAALLLVVSYTAPGNFVRAAEAGGVLGSQEARMGIGVSFVRALGGAFEGYKWWIFSALIPCLLFSGFLLQPRWDVKKTGLSLPVRAALVLGAGCVFFFGAYFLTFITSNKAPYLRILNAIVTGAFVLGVAALAFLHDGLRSFLKNRNLASPRTGLILGVFALLTLCFLPNTWKSVRNFTAGNMHAYYATWQQRLALLPPKEQAAEVVLELPGLPVRPFPIIFRDLEEKDPSKRWIANLFAQYHGLKGVRIVPGAAQQKPEEE